jgi:hypothetical protein
MEEARINGSDLKDIIAGLKGQDLANIITQHQDNIAPGGNGQQVLDPETRLKITKALADKKQLDLIGRVGESITTRRQRRIDAMLEAMQSGGLPQDIVGKLDSADQAHIIENNLFNPETRAKAIESLAKKGKLDLVPESVPVAGGAPGARRPVRATAFAEAIANGVDAEDLEKSDYHVGEYNQSRVSRLVASGIPIVDAPTAAKNEVLDENIGKMDGDQLRNIDEVDLHNIAQPAFNAAVSSTHDSITYVRVSNLKPEAIKQFNTAAPGKRRALKRHLPELDHNITRQNQLAATALLGNPAAVPPVPPNPAQADVHTKEANRLLSIRRAIDRLRP